MIVHVIHASQMNLHYGTVHTEDIAPEAMCETPGCIVNHPTWILGHVTLYYDQLASGIGLGSELPGNWGDLFEYGTEPKSDPKMYPTKHEMVDMFVSQHERVAATLPNVDPAVFSKPIEDEMLKNVFATFGDMVVACITVHEGIHLGQLSAWRWAMGMPIHI